jgi:uncharacterized damage-inducible protein DinB
MTTLDLIASGYRIGKNFVHNFCRDLTPEEFHFQPVPGANSAAWIVGHLAHTLMQTAKRLGVVIDAAGDEEFLIGFKETRHAAGVQHNLGIQAELLALFDRYIDKVIETVPLLTNEILLAPASNAPAFVSNRGEMLLLGAMHITLHVGQLSTIRRSLGKPPLL